MMKRIALFSLALLLAAPVSAFAHPEDEVFVQRSPQLMAASRAGYVVETMTTRGVIEASWRNLSPASVVQRQRNGAAEWVVTYRNDAIANPARPTLYVMLTPAGDYIAANYTGE